MVICIKQRRVADRLGRVAVRTVTSEILGLDYIIDVGFNNLFSFVICAEKRSKYGKFANTFNGTSIFFQMWNSSNIWSMNHCFWDPFKLKIYVKKRQLISKDIKVECRKKTICDREKSKILMKTNKRTQYRYRNYIKMWHMLLRKHWTF